jgi:hypothetical protein
MARALTIIAALSACSSSSSRTAERDAAETAVERCERGDGAACLEASRKYLVTPGPDRLRGIELLDRGCQAGNGRACYELGTTYHHGSGVDKDEARAIALVRRGCELEDVRSCVQAGKERIKAGGPNHLAEARALFERGCRHGDGESCFGVGVTYQQGGDLPAARRAYSRSCELGFERSCTMLPDFDARFPAVAGESAATESDPLMECYNKCFAVKDPSLSVKQLEKRCQDRCKFPDDKRF